MQSRAILQTHFEAEVSSPKWPMPFSINHANFPRRNAEMEREIADLRQRISSDGTYIQPVEAGSSEKVSQSPEDMYYGPEPVNVSRGRTLSAKLEPQTLATPLTMQSDGSMVSQDDGIWRLEDVSLSRHRVARLFEQCVSRLSVIPSNGLGIDDCAGSSSTITLFFLF